jgi:hypothetical protein
VTDNTEFGDFRAIVGSWRAKVPLKLVVQNDVKYLVCEDTQLQGVRVIARVPVGSILRIEQLKLQENVQVDRLRVTGRLVGGEYSGEIVQLDSNFFPRDVLLFYQIHHSDSSKTKPPWATKLGVLERAD